MPPKAGIKGKQPSVQEGSFLLFLRSVGYKEELPPSTIAWLEDAPVFKFLASRLSSDNFVSAEDQQEYNEIMLARGPNPELYEALGDSCSDEEDDFEQQSLDDQCLEDSLTSAELQETVHAWENRIQLLEEKIASLKAVSGRVDASVSITRSNQTHYLSVQAHTNMRLAAARADLSKLNTEVNEVLASLAGVCSHLTGLLKDSPQHWLLSVADMSGYDQQDMAARQVFARAMGLLNAAGVVRQLDPTASPAPAANTQHNDAAAPSKPGFQSALTTPERHKPAPQQQQPQQQQALPLLTPRGHNKTHRAEHLQKADVKRHHDQEARNAALLRELMRQRVAFKLSLDNLVKAEVDEAGVKQQLAAAHDIRQKSGGFARYRSKGPGAVSQLSQEVIHLEERRQMLYSEDIPALTEDIARLNDTYIVAGDYDRQLRKMAVATERKQAVLRSLVDTTSRHLLLLMVGSQEKQRLMALKEELEQTKRYLEGHVDAINTRVNRCVAAQQALQQAHSRSNLQPDDLYLMTLLAAADGSLSTALAESSDQQQQQQQQQGSVCEPGTPLAAVFAANGRQVTPRSARTPNYMPVKNLTDQLRQISTSMQQSSSQLQQLMTDLPKQLDKQATTDKQLYELAYPAGQSCAPLVTKESQHAAQHGSSSNWGTGSVVGSSAAPSLRSRSVRSASSSAASGSALGQHPLPLLRVPEVAEQQAALEKANKQLFSETQKIVKALEQQRLLQMQHHKEALMEQKAPGWFYTNPDKLTAYVARLQEEVEALEVAQHMQ